MSTLATVTWKVDTVAPAAVKLSGIPAVPTKARSLAAVLTGEAGSSFQCQLDGGDWSSCSSPKLISGLVDGPHSFAARQSDAAGNQSLEATVTWTVDNDAPLLSGSVRSLFSASKKTATVTSTFDSGHGKPDKLEVATSKTSPKVGSVPVAASVVKYGSPASVKVTAAPTWARVGDLAGNWSPWYAVTK